MKTQRYRLVTEDGQTVYVCTVGISYSAQYRLYPTGGRPVDATDASSSPEGRERVRTRAEKDTGRRLVWVDGGEAEYFPV